MNIETKALWNKVFKTDDLAWIERLDNEQAESVHDVLKSIVEEIAYRNIYTLRDIIYAQHSGEFIKVDETEIKELMMLNAIDLLRIRGNDYLYCDISAYEIENLIFEKLGAKNGFRIRKVSNDIYQKITGVYRARHNANPHHLKRQYALVRWKRCGCGFGI